MYLIVPYCTVLSMHAVVCRAVPPTPPLCVSLHMPHAHLSQRHSRWVERGMRCGATVRCGGMAVQRVAVQRLMAMLAVFAYTLQQRATMSLDAIMQCTLVHAYSAPHSGGRL